ncbi:DUF6114 domain-containing protein [Micromonospora sp. NBC_00362]|uniref:DUF6114 domain-containing protein n=1 Tax=Micromonospora sp. NBC_00362 TaxID=2975975 RepID=UPI00224EFF71|nr:DUF6114 domain-containing protein [Micromonospora sp. NBC_00362]MCX5119871.1 DUF6114 domain-containing protein [Micromonospora sp. NBC_00362]
MTTANPSHARPGGPAQAWRLFRRWQRSRPFWGGLLIALAGLEMFASTRMTLNGLSFHSGATGLLSLLIPIILVTCGLLLWITPAQRLFYSVVAAVTAVYSLIGLNLGGFFVGLLLGIVGSALAFAWTPIHPTPPTPQQAEIEQNGDDQGGAGLAGVGLADGDADGSDSGGAEQDGAVRADHPAGGASDEGAPPEWPGRSADPRAFAIALVVLGLAAVGLASQPRAVQAAPNRPASTGCPTPPRAVTPSPSRSAPMPTPTPSPARGGNVITDILDGIGDLLGIGDRADPAPSVRPTATPTARPTSTATPRPGPTDCPSQPPGKPTPGKPGTPAPGRPGTVQPGKLLPRIAADPGLPTVAQTPSKLSGSSVRMTGLRFDGVTDLHTVKGDLKVLKFSMREAVTADFLLRADGPAGRNQRYATSQLTVRGDVAFYATRFVGRLLGIKITLTPDLPLPDGLPITSPIPITFTDPAIDLAYVTSDTLTARPALALTLG